MAGYKVAIFTLNQWALDFDGNTNRVIESIKQAHNAGAIYRAGPELEICGYSLEDAFYESETVDHCWTCLKQILDVSKDMEMVVDVGMPVRFSALFNCRVICYRGEVVCIRAKTSLAREGNYREIRHFQAWPADSGVSLITLPRFDESSQRQVPIGADFILELNDQAKYLLRPLRIGWEICQELWDIKNVSARMYSDFGCHLILNGSASYWELRKLETINDMIKGISLRAGACYALSNLVGCDGQRYIFSGRSCIYENGRLICVTPRSSKLFEDVQMITHTINPNKIDEQRAQMGVHLNLSILKPEDRNTKCLTLSVDTNRSVSQSGLASDNQQVPCMDVDLNPKIRFESEIHLYVSLWLWDYLRRSGLNGFMMPLSGGLDSSSVAVLVYSMCTLLYEMRNSMNVKQYFSRRLNVPVDRVERELSSPEKMCSMILKCRYISTQYSSRETQNRAEKLSKSIGADFDVISIQDLFERCRCLAGRQPHDEVNLLDQNIQARLRMAMTYYLSEGDRIVLATGNVDEGIMGYLTKYDCSSADINPIGGLCKADLRSYLKFCCSNLFANKKELVEVIQDIIDAPPSAELTGAEQRDEDEIGITYDEISVLGRVRRGAYGCSGPSGAFETVWLNRNNSPFNSHIRCLRLSSAAPRSLYEIAEELAGLVKRFYQRYARNRHKLTILTPALHAETYSPDDNRFDHRQILFPPLSMQFRAIDSMVDQIKKHGCFNARVKET